MTSPRREPLGPFEPAQLPEVARYELSRGHAVACSPSGPRRGAAGVAGALPLATDPAVTEVGFDVGHDLGDRTLRAPDVSVGNVPNTPGWAPKAPLLALEYADTGQDEEALIAKIDELARAGTRFIWLVRLVGPRRVEVYEDGKLARVATGSDVLHAPGALANDVPVAALYDHDAALDVSLRNLLARKGFASLDAVRAEGRAEGRDAGRVEGREEGRGEGLVQGLVLAIEDLCEAFGAPLTSAQREALGGKTVSELEGIRRSVKRDKRLL